jgi:hypothetical protein
MDWLFNYVVVQTTPPGIHHLQWGLYLIYAILNASFVPLVYYLVVETRGRSLEETDRWFEANRAWLVHKADHNSDTAHSALEKGRRLPRLKIADDHEGMMRAFETSSDLESLESDSPVTRRGSYPMLE